MLGAAAFIRYLASLDGLAACMTEQCAAELCWALTDGHLYRLLVAQGGLRAPTDSQLDPIGSNSSGGSAA